MKLITALACSLFIATFASAQAVVLPAPVPSCANNDVLKWNTATSLFVCASAAATSQPLSDVSGLIANAADPTKILAFSVSGIATATTRTWTIPNADITVPTTIASLAANTFTALQTLNGGITTTTGVFSSTVSIAGATTLNTVAYTWPGSQGAADTFLKNNGAGVLTWGTQSAALPSPVTQNLIFTDNTYDIGASGATRPRNYFGAGNMTLGGTLGVTGASTLTSLAATSGTFSTTLSVTGASTLAAISATSGSFSSIITATGAISSNAGLAGTTGTFSNIVTMNVATVLSAPSLNIDSSASVLILLDKAAATEAATIDYALAGSSMWTTGYRTTAGAGADTYSIYSATRGANVMTLSGTGTAVRFNGYGAGTATFDASGNITSVSDERMKDIQGPFTQGLTALMGIAPIRYRYTEESGLDTENVYAGFSAQNVMGYIPEAVGKNLDGLYSLNIVPVLAATVTAVQELAREVDDLRVTLKLPAKNRAVARVTNETRIVNSATPKRLAEVAKEKADAAKAKEIKQ